MKFWNITRSNYLKWIDESNLKEIFAKQIRYKKLSLWWISSLMDKDNINDQLWYNQLNNNFNYSVKYQHEYKLNIFFLGLKLILRLFKKLIFISLIKIIFFSAKKKIKKKNGLYSLYWNCKVFKDKFIDRQYGSYSINNDKDILYFLEVKEEISTFKNIFEIKKNLKMMSCEYLIVNKHISILEILDVYISCIKLFFKTYKILKKKNYFIIKNIDCRPILEKKLLFSYFGQIQDQLIKGIALNNALKKTNIKNFLNYMEFYPTSRALYYFIKKRKKIKNIITINHANYSKNNLFFSLNKGDFNNDKKRSVYNSPAPDVYLCQGKIYFNYLRKILKKKKIFNVGSLKTEVNEQIVFNKHKKINKNKYKKQNILILCSLNDYQGMIKIINKSNLKKIKLYIKPHPYFAKKTIKEFNEKLKYNYIDASKLNFNEVYKNSDFIFFGDTSLGLELALKKYNIFRLYHKDFVPTFDIDSQIPTVTNHTQFENIISSKKQSNISSKLESNYFYKYDMKNSKRLSKILNSL
tara:strand:- start:38 stop:1606 length:1569 start_codon:yes stop_codon:yes gene_type:complete